MSLRSHTSEKYAYPVREDNKKRKDKTICTEDTTIKNNTVKLSPENI